MAHKTGFHIETLHRLATYTSHELELACKVASYFNRGKLVLTQPPRKRP